MSNSIWKTGSPKGIHEEDRLGDYYVAESHREDGSSFYEAGGTCDICGIPDRWTFLTDLISQADKAERLQKAVDLAVGALKKINETYEEEYYKGDDEHDSCDWLNCADDMDDLATDTIDEIEQLIKGG